MDAPRLVVRRQLLAAGWSAEKLREDEIRDLDLRMVRWIWAELDGFDPVAERLCRAFAASPARARWRR